MHECSLDNVRWSLSALSHAIDGVKAFRACVAQDLDLTPGDNPGSVFALLRGFHLSSLISSCSLPALLDVI